jgi:hypothetical protein
MPTGYTADVCDGKLTDFKAFAIRCAHAFGALVELRDEGMDAPIPEFKPSPYHVEGLQKAHAELARLKGLSRDEAEAEARAAFRKAMDAHHKHVEEQQATKGRLLAMRAQVADWQPPTSEHQGLKDFMIQQIDETIRFDCSPSTYYLEKCTPKGGEVWRREQISEQERSIEYHTKQNAEDIERVAHRNKWVADLRKSLQVS